MKRIFSVLAFMFSTASPVLAANDDWHWVMALPNSGAWDVSRGIARDVEFDGRKFSADLYRDDLTVHPKAPPVIRLKGTISNGEINASAVYIGTDAGPEPFHGTLKQSRVHDQPWNPDHAMETDHIILSGSRDTFLGITRLLQIGTFKQNPQYCASLKKNAASSNPTVAEYNQKELAQSGC